ncbi:MAG: hypothetical protein QM232_06815, partial [Bacteroidota bacterium]|nr:hypothetical protein [Bacteroidota bacterium]
MSKNVNKYRLSKHEERCRKNRIIFKYYPKDLAYRNLDNKHKTAPITLKLSVIRFLRLLLAAGFVMFIGRTDLSSQETILLDASTNGQIRETCFANFYDSGGSGGSYGYNQDYSITFISPYAEGYIKAILKYIWINQKDTLFVFDSDGSTIAHYTYTLLTPDDISIKSSGRSLSFRFVSSDNIPWVGWKIRIACDLSNDEPCGAITLPVTKTCETNTFNNLDATRSAYPGDPGCFFSDGAHDVWFKIIAPDVPDFTAEISRISNYKKEGGIKDGAFAIYKGTCSSLSFMYCDDDDPVPGNENFPKPATFTRGTHYNAGDTIFIRFWGWGTERGFFNICVYSDHCSGALAVDAGPDKSICSGGSAVIGGSSVSAVSFLWTPSSGLSDTRVEHPTASPSETMPYRLIGLDSDGCSDIDNLIVFVTKLRTDMTVSDPSICEGGTASVILSDSEKGVSYQLRDDSNDSPVGTPVVGTGKNIVLLSSPVTTTTYNVLATNLSTLCSAELTDKAVVTVVPDPAIMTQPSGDLICSGETHTMSVTATGGIPSLTYQWEESDDNGVSDAWANAVGGTGSATATYTTPALTATRYYRVVISATGAGCGTIISNSVAVTVDRTAPTGTAPAGTSNINACYVDAVTLPAGTPAFDPVATAAGYSDNNGGAVTATLINTQVSGNNCGWIVTYTFKVSDECGNALTGQTIVHSGRDQTPPTGTAPSGSTGVNACYVDAVTLPAGTPVFDAEAAAAGYTDNCGGTVTATLINTQVSGNNCGWIVTYTFKVSDECGNELTDQTIVHSGSDQTAPTGTAPSGSTGVNACYVDAVTLPAGTPAFDPVAAAAGYTDNCGGAVTATLTNT